MLGWELINRKGFQWGAIASFIFGKFFRFHEVKPCAIKHLPTPKSTSSCFGFQSHFFGPSALAPSGRLILLVLVGHGRSWSDPFSRGALRRVEVAGRGRRGQRQHDPHQVRLPRALYPIKGEVSIFSPAARE